MIKTTPAKSRPNILLIMVSVGLLLVAGYLIKLAFAGRPTVSSLGYYTTDDGVTTFTDRLDLFPPFEHDGKQAVRAWVFTSDEGKTSFVGYLERCNPAAKARLESETADFKSGKLKQMPAVNAGDTEVKRPGSNGHWVGTADRAAANQVTHFTSPGAETPDLMLP